MLIAKECVVDNSSNIKQSWNANLKTEVDYWKWYAKNKNDSEVSLLERASFDREVIPLAKPLIANSGLKVLDVGSGPVSYLGYQYNGSLLDITLVDPL